MIFPLLFVLLGGCLTQAGSIVLTSSPVTATAGEAFTLICSSNANGGRERQWSRDGTSPVLITTRSSTRYTVSNPDFFNRYLSGRVNVTCDATQHNLTLIINSTVDNGSRWQCVDYVSSSPRSNTLTIYVMLETTTNSSSNNTTTGRPRSTAGSTTTTNNNDNNTTGSPISTSDSTTDTSNNNNTTTGRPISTSGFTTTTNNNNNPAGTSTGQSDTIAIAVGAAGGGVAVIAVVIVAAVCIRKRRRSVGENVRDKSRRDRNPSRSAEMLIESGVTGENVMMDNNIYTSSSEAVPAEYSIQGHNQAVKVVQDNILYTSSSDIAPADYHTGDPNPFGKDVYTEVKKVKTNADEHKLTDMYAKPHKGRKETPIGDMYAQVNKVKSREGTSENIEDMYAKPQKDKRNVKSNADTD